MDRKRWLTLAGAALATLAIVFFGAACDDDEDGADATATEPEATEPAPTEPEATEAATEPAAGTDLDISAQDTSFSTDSLEAPADTAFSVVFEILDSGIPHTFSVYESQEAADGDDDPLAATDQITGPGSETLEVGPLEAGDYYFQCDVHPAQMSGTLTVQ